LTEFNVIGTLITFCEKEWVRVKIVAQFEIPYYQILNDESQIVDKLPKYAEDPAYLIELYRWMVLNRIFDTKAIALQRTGKLGTYPSARGQEAVFVGIGASLSKEDVFVPYYRDVAALIQRGVLLKEILLYWGGDESGNAFESDAKDFAYSVPIGTQTLHAAGVATAFKIKQEKGAVLVTCGDGATSEGDFYEAINVAGVWKLPIVFVVCNNQWAISVPLKAQTACQTLAQKAIAAGIDGEQVDGNDVIGIRDRIGKALEKARSQNLPTVIELLSYRHGDHTTADDASRYEPKNSRETEWKKEPIIRLRKYLENLKQWNETLEEKLIEECTKVVEQSVQDYLSVEKKNPEVMIDYLYAELPDALREQREEIKNLGVPNHG
jgi:pyruvate dehydrogenase E1 component alpha subunit